MTVWVEQARWVRAEENCGHMLAEDLDQLHALAQRIELDKGRYFNRHALIPHYSIPEGLIQSAIDAGAVELTESQRNRILTRVLSIMANRQLSPLERGPDALPRRRKGQQAMFEE